MTPPRTISSRCARTLLLLAGLGGCTNQGPAQTPDAHAEPTPAADPVESGATFASPPQSAQQRPPDPPAPDDPELRARVAERFGERCRLERICGDLAGVDCDSAVDGPYYYVNRADLTTLSTCGGACRGGACTECPPKGWSCATY